MLLILAKLEHPSAGEQLEAVGHHGSLYQVAPLTVKQTVVRSRSVRVSANILLALHYAFDCNLYQ